MGIDNGLIAEAAARQILMLDDSLLELNVGQIPGVPKNPRFIRDKRFEDLCRSIREDPEMMFGRPLFVYELEKGRRYVTVAGNMRLRACRNNSWPKMPVWIFPADTEPKKLRAVALKDNISFGQDDMDLLANEWSEEELTSFGMELPADWNGTPGGLAEEDEFEIPAVIQTDIKTGDLFEIGRHRVMCGNSVSVDDVEKLIAGAKIEIICTDPPYGVNYTGKTEEALQIKNDAMTDEQTHKLFADALDAAWSMLKDGGSIYATVPPGPLHLGFANVLLAREALRQILVWNKDSMVLGHSDYHYKHEPILYGWKPGASHYFTKDRTQTTVLDFDRPKASREHPTMKPVPLWAKMIENSSKKNAVVYDPFGGSGTTVVTCEQIKRRAIVMEIDPHYVQVIVDRAMKAFPDIIVTKNGQPYIPVPPDEES